MAYLPPLNGGRINASIGGNTAGAGSAGAVSTGTVLFAGGNNVTLSQATGAGGATISFNAPAPSGFSAGISAGLGNTSGTTGFATNKLVFAGGNNLTLSQATGAGGNTLTIAAPFVSSISATGALSISNNGSTISMGVPAYSAGIIAGTGNTSGTAGLATNQLVLAGGNNITLSQATGTGGNTLTISAGGQSVQSQNLVSVNGSTGNISFDNGGNVKFGFNASTISASFSQSIQTQGVQTVNLGGNTAGAMASISSGAMSLYGGNNITLSQNANSVTIIGTSGGGGGGGVALSANNLISSGTASLAAGGAMTITGNGQSLTFSAPPVSSIMGSNGITISTTGSTISIIGNGTGGGGGGGGGIALYDGTNSITSGTAYMSVTGGALTISNAGQTMNFSVPGVSSIFGTGAINLSTSGNTVSIGAPAISSLSATGAISISTSGNTISIGAPFGGGGGTLSNWEPLPLQYGSVSNTQKGNGSMYFYKLQVMANVSASRMMQLASISVSSSSNSSHAGALSIAAGIYSANGSTLSLITQSSGSTYYQWTNTSNNSYTLLTGLQGMSMPFNLNATPGNYWIGMWSRSSTTNANWFTASNIVFTMNNSSYQGMLMSPRNATDGVQEGVGAFSATSSAMPVSAAFSQITQSVLRTNAIPYMVFKNQTW